jgi:hypothetical protein
VCQIKLAKQLYYYLMVTPIFIDSWYQPPTIDDNGMLGVYGGMNEWIMWYITKVMINEMNNINNPSWCNGYVHKNEVDDINDDNNILMGWYMTSIYGMVWWWMNDISSEYEYTPITCAFIQHISCVYACHILFDEYYKV